MPRFRAPQQSRGRLQASFGRTAKRSAEQKNGRKCDLATALLPKGDTRATNAKTEYHGRGGNASVLWRRVASRILCKFEKGFSFPGTVQVRDDAVDDAVAALRIGEAGHGAGTAAHFAEGAFDHVGGAQFFPVRFRQVEEVQ